MKKLAAILIACLILAGFAGYYFANKQFQKQATKLINQNIQKAGLKGQVSYKSIDASLISKSITVNKITWKVKQLNKIIGKLDIQSAIIKGNLNSNYKIKLKNLTFVNLDYTLPKELLNKTLFTAKEGYLEYKKKQKGKKVESSFQFENILLTDSFSKDFTQQDKQFNEYLHRILLWRYPIELKGKASINKEKQQFDLKNYSIDWQNNFRFAYSMNLKNFDFDQIQSNIKKINNGGSDPITLITLLGATLRIKPEKIEILIKDKGIKERILNDIRSKDNITDEQLIEELNASLTSSKIASYKDNIINFIKTKNGQLKIKITNPNDYSIKDILQASNGQDLTKILKIELKNR